MLIQTLLGKRDLLVPYFKFRKELQNNLQSELLKEIFALRYEVYCLECHYLPTEEFQNGLESDEYDACSAHFAAFTLDDSIIGTVRLVQPPDNLPYPFQSHCSVFEDFVMPPREQCGEISRLVVRKTHRRRRGDSMEGVSRDFFEKGSVTSIKPHSDGKKREGNSPMLLLGLYREIYRYSRQNGVRYFYAAMERSLARSLDKMGFPFVRIGPQTDYYGPVTPFILDINELYARLHKENKFLAAWFTDEPIPPLVLLRVFTDKIIRRFFKKQ
ncbi:MAG: PEP-CTERM/exosortase system-associated acyltransferase [Undibacterium sp.]|uniref:PEP-CTERM/exosortase system-associated acyltransferase n=1 Tax=Undibacterium sp. TaxID=1914977 RepID=UPI00271F0775|nr:PEP-CTERM/exosortase system-associated acyltransferase [Undibacterium sp.]MDO8652749.1 PEP-CTERM/exosortase system-associated acyltransferase [Undibacterium sp.]